jgi:drug/metabolite transporter (DMT)-like permease
LETKSTITKRLALVGLILAVISWGASFFLAIQAIREVGVWPYLTWRFALAPLVLMAVFPKKFLGSSRALVGKGLLVGVSLFLAVWTQTMGLQYTTAGRSGFITALYVPFTPLIGWLLFRQVILFRQLAVAAVSALGLYMLTQRGDLVGGLNDWFTHINRGDIWTFFTAVATAAQIVLVDRFTREEPDSLALGLWQLVGCSLSAVPCIAMAVWLGAGVSSGGSAVPLWNPLQWSGAALGALLFNVLIVTCFGFTMQVICQKSIGALKAALIFGLEGPFAALFGYAFLREIMGPAEACGAFLVFLTSIIPERWLKRS